MRLKRSKSQVSPDRKLHGGETADYILQGAESFFNRFAVFVCRRKAEGFRGKIGLPQTALLRCCLLELRSAGPSRGRAIA